MNRIKFYLAGLAFFGLLYSCDSDDDNNDNANAADDLELLRTASAMDRINNEDFQLAMETAGDESALDSRPGDLSATSSVSCATLTQTSVGTGFPLTFNLDFGNGCTHNGVTRSGSLSISFTGYLLAQGSQLIITYNNYVVNGYAVQGTVTYTNETSGNGPQWTRAIVGGQVTTPQGGVYTYTETRTIRQTAGASTIFNLNDNTFEVSAGTATITRPNGSSLTATVSTPLVKNHTCAWISAGILTLDGTTLDGELDYGDNTCDNLAVYTHSDGSVVNIELD